MRIPMRFRGLTRRPWFTPLGLSLCWCLLLLLLHAWTERVEEEHTLELARLQASTLHAQIVDTRAWNSAHGGVYVPENAWTRPNPWLPPEEQGLTMGKMRLVKLNPAYMTRQIAELASATAARFRISSLTPVRADNLSDPWEGKALADLAEGRAVRAVFELVPGPDGDEFRYMAPLYAVRDCLSCHRDNKAGDIRGGISVSIAAAPILAASAERKRANTMAFLVLGLVGVSGIGGATFQMNRRRVQAEEANRAKTAFLAHISHDMRTPLTGILGMLARLEQDCPNHAGTIGHVRASASSLLTTVQDMMSHALKEEARLPDRNYPFCLRAALTSCVDAVRPACMDKGLGLELRIAPELPERLIGNAYRVRQVVGNLLGNAVKFTERGGVYVHVSGVRDGENCRLRVDVRDTGPGVQSDDRECIFQRFVHREQRCAATPGRGLGLSIARQLARGMGGDISLESGGEGSVFRFTAVLPVAAAAQQGGCAPPDAARHAHDPTRRFAGLTLFDERAALEALDGRADFLGGICGVLCEELDDRRAQVERFMAQGQPEEALGHVHALKNSAATLGCERLRQCSAELEQTLRRGNQDAALLAAWLDVAEKTRMALDEHKTRQEEKTHGAHSDRG